MSKLVWDQVSEHLYETGVDHGVLYTLDENKAYKNAHAWNGLTGITESPSGADETKLWADNIKYLSLRAAEEFGGTIEAYTYPDEFAECDGSASIATGVFIGQQSRKVFGLSYRKIPFPCYTSFRNRCVCHRSYGMSVLQKWQTRAHHP